MFSKPDKEKTRIIYRTNMVTILFTMCFVCLAWVAILAENFRTGHLTYDRYPLQITEAQLQLINAERLRQQYSTIENENFFQQLANSVPERKK